VYQVLARKWRPKKFNDVIGQEHITKTLVNSIEKNKVAHAYLFTGTRGVGKTTIARIFAKSLRCENRLEDFNPCGECNSCKSIDSSNSLDYVEIDGASNNSVDNIRELIENVNYLPSSGKYKVYVIDEVHMLSNSAFNALLKTLEEPPAHVVFIFATTDPHKLLGTVLSRCQRFDFKNVSNDLLVDHVNKICKAEGIQFENESLVRVLARHGDGSVRDTLSLLDQVISLSTTENISEKELFYGLGLINQEVIDNILNAILLKDKDLFVKNMAKAKEENISYTKFLSQLLDSLFNLISEIDNPKFISQEKFKDINFQFISTAELMWMYESVLKDSNWVLQSFDIMRALEFSLLKVVEREEILNINPKKKSSVNQVVQQQPQEIGPEAGIEKVSAIIDEVVAKEEIVDVVEAVEDVKEVEEEFVEKNWDNFISFAMTQNKAIAVNLERAILNDDFDPQNLVILFGEEEKIFRDFLSDPDNFKSLLNILAMFIESTPDKVNISIRMLDNETKENQNLMNKVEKVEQEELINKEELENKLINNKFVKQAEDLFNTKVSKIVLGKNKD
jgi:DNA polymerase-3 subunit gamma/tau